MLLATSLEFTRYEQVPYLDKGRDLNGWDCFGLYRFLLAELHGVSIPSYADDYGSAEDRAGVSVALSARSEWVAVPRGSEQQGDGIVFLVGGVPCHCGYVLKPGIMLHAMQGRGTCVERYTSPMWSKRIEGIYRWKS